MSINHERPANKQHGTFLGVKQLLHLQAVIRIFLTDGRLRKRAGQILRFIADPLNSYLSDLV